MQKNYVKQLLKIAVPIMLSNIISQVQMLTDRAFLGNVNILYMSALGNASSPMWTTMSFCFSIVTGASIIISQMVGRNERQETETYAASLLKWINILPLAMFLFWICFGRFVFVKMGVSANVLPMCMEYLRYFSPIFLVIGIEAATMVIMQTSNYTKPLIWFGLIRSLLNVLLDWIMIFGKFGCPAMGITGAAIATTISEYVGLVFSLIIFIKSEKIVTRPSLSAVIKAPLMPFLKSARLGVNTALEDFAWNCGNLALIAILNTINEKAAGIYSMIFGIEILAVVLIGAIGNGTMTLTSEATGAGDVKKYKSVPLIAYLISAGFSFVMLVACLAAPKSIIGIFTKDEAVIASCGLYLILMCVNLYSKSGNIIVGNAIRGYGDTRWMFFTQIAGTVSVVAFALLFVKVFDFGMTGVFMAVLTDEFLRAGVNFGKFRWIVKKMALK